MSETPHILRTGARGIGSELQRALADLTQSLRQLGLAWALAKHDIAARYRGSILGPFWITLSMGVVIAGTGTLYATLFKVDTDVLLPHLACGLVIWTFLASTLGEGCESFINGAGILRQTALPMFTFIWRTVFRNLLTLAHHAVIIVVVLLVVGAPPGNVLLSVLGLLGLVLLMAPLVMLVAIGSARFRDIPQVVMAVIQFMMFMTPIFWMTSQVGRSHAFLSYNPFYYYIDVVRSPLIGHALDPRSWPVLTISLMISWGLAMFVFARTRRRIVHFL
ncbi:ABC transporter permease [Phenylobacterium sp.]|uniref:ABC transporter permease n=1 Tax=Phenylobacterium sp. TaxID=1871053 RepID=UPI0035AECC09